MTMVEPSPDDLEDTTVDLDDTTPRPTVLGSEGSRGGGGTPVDEANLILISHPEDRQLGRRFRVPSGSTVNIGRTRSCDLAFSEVMSLSRKHACLRYDHEGVSIEDLGSTNGSFVNDRRVQGRIFLSSGDRLQLGALHFKFLYGRDVEHAYYEAIYHLMTQDGLTEIYNRRTFDDELQREFSRSKRHHRPLSLIIFDVDHFKLINDRCGHLCGDFVLKGIVNLARKLLRREQVFARVGGDEFAILTPETGFAGAATLAEKLRARIAAHEFDPDLLEGTVRATCSFGVAELSGEMLTPDEFYATADQFLYTSKNTGRNRVRPKSDVSDVALDDQFPE
jgi:diguanylate cyclase (GGDEF)-like protein